MTEKALEKAMEVLRMNSTPIGFSASTERHSNYYSVWARDHSICSIAACLAGETDLVTTAKTGILFLFRHQSESGQLPSYIEIENKKKVYGGLGNITSVDSNMWALIAAALLYRKTGDKRLVADTNLSRYLRTYLLLRSFDFSNHGLIVVPKAGDWADIFNRTYHVLYDECLYYQALKETAFLFTEGCARTKNAYLRKKLAKRLRRIRKLRPAVKRKINDIFWFTKENIPKILDDYMIIEKLEEKDYGYYQSHLMPFKHHWQNRFETFGNVLAIVTGIANRPRSRRIFEHIRKNKISEPFPIRCLCPPVYKNERGWESIYRLKEQPHTYHNGGIWPVIAGFWIHALVKRKMEPLAKKELSSFALQLQKDNWMFHEYYHGKELRPMGRTYQAWSAAGYIIAYHSVKSSPRVFT